MRKRAHLVISGRVQGVCFRMCTLEEARRLGMAGWVRNRADGAVEVTAEGEETPLAEFVAWCRHGPPYAQVTGVRESVTEAAGEFSEFRITH
jgi:acylphosphatase